MSDWNRETAEWYAAKYGEYPTNRLAVDLLNLAPDSVVVDVGCGTGAALRHVAAVVAKGILIGVDPVPRMVEIARARTASHDGKARIEYREGPAEALPVADDTADFVLAFDSIDHWRDRDRGLSEVRRVLRRTGTLVLVKDGGLPGGSEAIAGLSSELSLAGFHLIDERSVEEGEVSFTMWICALASES